ncbi:sulfatase-like hydrolase/transferase [Paenibacillus sp. HB172176]|uniref:sulfatase family protein n=1 Tax=Paenibacillus sp. HB172176 TaxID=2493690 RepID=UPI00143C3488|nr:sulfatase-like hydrolase/transferase [Paenibacillus sp. HB172176]
MKQNRKNILFLFTDQQRADTIEALGNSIIKTPSINRLVENGVAFTRAYSPCPVCVPARFALHTGLLPHRTDCVINERMPDGYPSFMELLSQAGYQTHGVGKMHFSFSNKPNSNSQFWGFDSRDVSEEGGGQDDFKTYLESNGFDHVHDPHGIRSEYYYIPQPSQLPERLHHTAWVADRSLDFLKRRDGDRPFLLMSSFIKPHPPFETPTPWNKLYRGPEMPLPKRPQDGDELISYWNRFQNRYKYRDQGVDDNLMRVMKAAYYSSLSFIDYHVGRILDYLQENGLMENTLIVYSSDHGEMLGDYDCVGKRNFLDAGANVPLIVSDPDGPKDVRCTKPVSLVDIMPTFLQAANIHSQLDLSGRSLLDIASGKTERDWIACQYHRGGYAMYMATDERYKYIYSAPDDKEWLFDLKIDPHETRNRAYNPMYTDQTRGMREKLISFYREEGYTAPMEGNEWRRYPIQSLPVDRDAGLLFQDPPSSIPSLPGYERDIPTLRPKPAYKSGF